MLTARSTTDPTSARIYPGSSRCAKRRSGHRCPPIRRAHRILTNPGVTAYVAVAAKQVVGFVYLLSDGELQAYIASMAVAMSSRRQGTGTRLIQEAFGACGAERVDLVSAADPFYE